MKKHIISIIFLINLKILVCCKTSSQESILEHQAGDLGSFRREITCKQDQNVNKLYLDYSRNEAERIILANKYLLPKGTEENIRKICFSLSDEFNASVASDGTISFGTKLMLASGMTADIFASILAHELAHMSAHATFYQMPPNVALKPMGANVLALLELQRVIGERFKEDMNVLEFFFELLKVVDVKGGQFVARIYSDLLIAKLPCSILEDTASSGNSKNICTLLTKNRLRLINQLSDESKKLFFDHEEKLIEILRQIPPSIRSLVKLMLIKLANENLANAGWKEILVNDLSIEMLIRKGV